MSMHIDIVAVTYHQDETMKCFINSLKSQTNPNWSLYIIHDGEDDFFHEMKKYLEDNGYLNDKIVYDCKPQKADNPWGHESRDFGIEKYIESTDDRFLIHTNVDNYFTPMMIEFILETLEDAPQCNFMYWDCVHSHDNYFLDPPGKYGHLRSQLQECGIDMSCVAVKNSIAKANGFKYNSKNADWYYFSDILQQIDVSNTVVKLNKILYVHN